MSHKYNHLMNPLESLEMQEVIEKLTDNGFGDILTCLLDGSECWTKKGRLNKSSTCRKMNWKSKQLEDTLKAMRELLKNEFDLDEFFLLETDEET